ncbi:NAD(P)-dependent alcohol dehydrogenase [Nocardioides nanhaiensis]|uniref:NAD(P)-dependent alcohol dehydrogenase n=1 Tax=Nocardioides nanhaiensis TaxID=1476871 RepID=A0ABP8VPH2_9ACTN
MRAAVVQRYGPPEVVAVQEVPAPEPRRGQLRVRVHATPVTSGDARIRGARFPPGFAVPARLALGLRAPRRPVLGVCFSGVVDAVGPGTDSTAPAVGQAVCGMTGVRMGAHAEQVVVRTDHAVPVPAGVSHDDAAAMLFGGTTALPYLRDKGRLVAGHRVLVIGASGAVGTNAVQLARHLGAEVTGVCSPRNADLVAGLGATEVIHQVPGSGAYDVVLDAVGVLTPASGRVLLTPEGRLLLAVASLGQTLGARGRVQAGPAPERPADVAELLGLVAAGHLRAIVEQTYGLDDVVAAHARVDSGRKVGNLVLRPT